MQESFTFEFGQHGEAERWLPVVGVPYYEVSDWARVRSLDRMVTHQRSSGTHRQMSRGRILTPWYAKDGGYRCVNLGRGERRKICQLVAAAFIGPCPPGQEVLHGPNGALDDSPGNLSYGTHTENMLDKTRDGTLLRGTQVTQHKLTESDVREIRALLGTGEPQTSIAGRYGVCQMTISNIATGRSWAWLAG